MTKTLICGGGCFWCLEAAFKMIKGVSSVVPGYAGGDAEKPSYLEVCSGETGHAEVVKIEYNPEVVTLSELLKIFFAVHDPTTINRQGNDVGTQYRSILFYGNDEEKQLMEKFLNSPEIVTELKPLQNFYEAEDYHHDYFSKNPGNAYCQAVISPKLIKIRKDFDTFLST